MARKTSKCATAKVFQTGRSQAVRIPKEYRFECDEVFIEREGARIILTPRPRSRRDYFGKMRIASRRIFLNGSRISRLSSARSSDAAPDARTQYLHYTIKRHPPESACALPACVPWTLRYRASWPLSSGPG
jgi:virulence-associated protein VagC